MNNEQIKKQAEEKIKELQLIIDKLNKPKFKAKMWYKSQTCNEIAFAESEYLGYGFEHNGTWRNSGTLFGFKNQGFVLASNREVEEALIKEAKKRGYNNKTIITSFFGDGGRSQASSDSYTSYTGNEFFYYGICIMRLGEWAEIISEPKIMIGGYEVKIHMNDSYKIGCKTIRKQDLYGLNNMMIQTDVNEITFGEYKITRDTIEKILALKFKL